MSLDLKDRTVLIGLVETCSDSEMFWVRVEQMGYHADDVSEWLDALSVIARRHVIHHELGA